MTYPPLDRFGIIGGIDGRHELTEELGPAGEHLGNFPQAFTHVGLISAAYYLDRQLSRREG